MHKYKRVKKKPCHKVWELQEAKARFSELVDEVLQDGHHTVIRNGSPVVVIMSQKEFARFWTPQDSLIDFFSRAPFPEEALDLRRE